MGNALCPSPLGAELFHSPKNDDFVRAVDGACPPSWPVEKGYIFVGKK